MIMWVPLWTDVLIYVLLTVVVAFVVYARRREHLRAPWRLVARSRQAGLAAVVLGSFLLIGFLDSIHFRLAVPSTPANSATRYAAEVTSLLDMLLSPLRVHDEKTYSAPFATHLYAKETLRRTDGREVRAFPRLRYGGAQLANPYRDRDADIAARMLRAVAQATAVWLLSMLVLIAWRAWRRALSWRVACAELVCGRGGAHRPMALLALGVIMILIAAAINLAGHYHVFGTDKVGQDVFYETLKSIRTGLVIGTLTTLIMLPFAVLLGIAAGYFRGWIDDVIQYLYTTLNSIPGVLLIAAAVLMLQVYMGNHPDLFTSAAERADLRLLFLCIILGVTSWTGLCRLLRGETLKLRELEYIQAAGAFGVGHMKIITRHILPNVMHIVLINVVLDFSGLVLAEAVLSYVGVGVDPSMNSWGNMINSARLEMAREPMVWWPLLAAFVFMFTLVLAANLFADAVRDAFDPRLRQ